MKYLVERASGRGYSGEPPCDGAILYKKIERNGPYEKPNTYFYIWYIEIENMDDLWNLMNKEGEIIIDPNINQNHYYDILVPEWPLITIYDSWVE